MKSRAAAFLLWCLGAFGLCGLHRLYVGRVGTGLLWLGTFGLLGLGQLADLGHLGDMVRAANRRGYVERALRPVVVAIPTPEPTHIERTHVVERQVVKIRCGYCRTLVDEGVVKCPTCGAAA